MAAALISLSVPLAGTSGPRAHAATHAGNTELPSTKRTPTGLSGGRKGGEIAPAAKRMWLQIQTLEAEALEVGNPVDLGRGPDAWTCGGSASGLSAHDVTRYEPPMSPRPINAR